MLELGIFRGLESLLKAATGINDMVMKLKCLFFPRGQLLQFKHPAIQEASQHMSKVDIDEAAKGCQVMRVPGVAIKQFVDANYSHILRERNATMMIFSSILSADLTNN